MIFTCCHFGHNAVTDFNYQSSAYGLDVEGDYPEHFDIRFDNFTDSLMINISWFSSYGNPFVAAFAGRYYDDSSISKVGDLKTAVYDSSIVPNQIYPRYWHGYIVFLKPLLAVHEYHEIRVLNSLVFYLLFACSAALIFKKTGWKLFVAYVASIIMLDIHILPMSLQFSTDFIIMFLAVIIAIYLPQKKSLLKGLFFFVIGSLTMFFDFYTCPFITLCFPLIVFIVLLKKENIKTKGMVLSCLTLCGLWLAGYVFTWVAKNLISYFILGPQVFSDLFEAVFGRLHRARKFATSILQSYRAVKLCYDTFMRYEYLLIIYPVIALWILLFIFFRKKISEIKYILALLVPVLFSLLWISVGVNPITIHYWYQFRGIGVCFFAGFYIILSTIEYAKIKNLFARLKSIYTKAISHKKNK